MPDTTNADMQHSRVTEEGYKMYQSAREGAHERVATRLGQATSSIRLEVDFRACGVDYQQAHARCRAITVHRRAAAGGPDIHHFHCLLYPRQLKNSTDRAAHTFHANTRAARGAGGGT